MSENLNYNYAFVFYDINEKRVQKIFKICKKYFIHHQKSVFRGNITPANLVKLENDIKKIINKDEDFVTIIKLLNNYSFAEVTLGTNKKNMKSIIL